jgi:ribulose-phosphate 3-epimerase
MPEKDILISPSFLNADFGHLADEFKSVKSADWLHVDVMDGHFVDNATFSPTIFEQIDKDEVHLPLDIHLMVSDPDTYLELCERISDKHDITNITFHGEVARDTVVRRRLIERIHGICSHAGISINPNTPISDIEDIMTEVDLALLMTVQPGFGGQEFKSEVLEKIKELRKKVPELMIQVDGGINAETAAQCREVGANNLVAGSYVFGNDDREEAIRSLRG